MIVEELGWDSGSKVNVAINLILTLWSETLGKFETKILHLLISQVFSCCFRFSVRLYCIFSEWNKKNNNKYLINEEMHKFGFWIFPKFHSTVLRSSWLQHLFYCLNPSRGKLKIHSFPMFQKMLWLWVNSSLKALRKSVENIFCRILLTKKVNNFGKL